MAQPQEPFKRIGVDEAKRLIDEGVRVVDVREQDEWNSGHIPQATHLPLPQIVNNPEKSLGEGDREQPVVFVCAAGQRSAVASEVAAMLGYKDIYNLEGGTTAWIKSGNPVNTGA
jgi:rhodanese-related sulfurtransferase